MFPYVNSTSPHSYIVAANETRLDGSRLKARSFHTNVFELSFVTAQKSLVPSRNEFVA